MFKKNNYRKVYRSAISTEGLVVEGKILTVDMQTQLRAAPKF